MTVMRVNKTNNYTVMSNYHLRDTRLSLKAVGLLSKILSFPDNWDYSITGLVAICKENETAVKNALKELKEFGYLKVTKLILIHYMTYIKMLYQKEEILFMSIN